VDFSMRRNTQLPAAFTLAVIAAGPQFSLDATTPATQPSTPGSPTASAAALRIFQTQISQLQKELADANARDVRLQQENAELRRRLGMAPAISPPGAVLPAQVTAMLPSGQDASALFIELPVVKWDSKTAADKQELIARIPGATISLKPFNGTLTVKSVNSSHVTLLVQKTSKAIGDSDAIVAGEVFVQSGSLYLQWASGDQSTALEALKYASLEVRERPDAEPKIYSMVHPVESSVTLNQSAPAKLPLLPSVLGKGKLVLSKPSADWQSTAGKDGALVLQQNGLQVDIKLDHAGGVIATCAGPDPDHAQRRMDALNAKYQKEQATLADLQAKAQLPPKTTEGYWSGNLYYPPTVEDRSPLLNEIHSYTEDLSGMDKARPKLQAELDAVNAKSGAIAELAGTGLVVTLPNGVKVAAITLNVDSSQPKPARK
jgi:hypothetical protein